MHRRRPVRRHLTRWTAFAVSLGCAGLFTVGMPSADASAPSASRADLAHSGTGKAGPVRSTTVGTGPVVVIGTGGLRWADVSATATPALWSLLDGGATGDVTVRSVRLTTCPVDGWLTMSAGRRAADADVPGATDPQAPPCRAMSVRPGLRQGLRESPGDGDGSVVGSGSGSVARGPAVVDHWDRYLHAARDASFDARPGLLGDTLASAGVCATALGPGAAVMVARSDGSVAAYAPGLGPDGAARLHDPTCPLTVIDAGSIPGPPTPSRAAGSSDRSGQRSAHAVRVRKVDALVGEVLAAVPSSARVLVVSASDAPTARLQLVGTRGPGFGPGWVRTSSTRQPALVQLTDITPTVLSLLGMPSPVDLVGSPLSTLASAHGDAPATVSGRLQRLLDLDDASWSVHPLTPRFFTGLVALALVVLGAAVVALRGRRPGATAPEHRPDHDRVRDLARRAALTFAAVPVSTYLANTVPWWRSSHPLVTITLVVAGYTAAISVVAQVGPWRRTRFGSAGAVAGISAGVLAVDVLTGSRLQLSSLLGVQPSIAGRFYGFSNVAFALFATGALMLAVVVADHEVSRGRRSAAALAVGSIGAVATALDVMPAWGSDFGGPIGMMPAFALLTLLVLGVRITWQRLLAIGAGTVALLTVVSVADWLRPTDSQTHLGRFVQTVIDGGAWGVIERKAAQNLDILTGSALSLAVPVGAVLAVLTVLRPATVRAWPLLRAYRWSPTLRHGLRCLLVMVAIGFAVNDTGTVIPAIAALLALPLVIAMVMTDADDGTPTRP